MTELDRAYHFARCLRMVVVALCRGAAIVSASVATVTLIRGVMWYFDRRPMIKAGLAPSGGAFEWLYLGMEQLAPAILLVSFSGYIARWLVPAPKAACLRCGYSTVKLTKPVCPECGAPVPLDHD